MKIKLTDQVFKILGLESSESLHIKEALKFYAPSEKERISEFVKNCVINGTSFDDGFQLVNALNEKKWIRTIGEAQKDETGEIIKIRGVFQDITLQVKQEAHASQITRFASLGKLARGIGHEINNPLAIIKGYSYLLQKNLENSPESYRDHFQRINDGIERIKNIVQGIKDFTEGDTDQLEIVDLGELIGSSLSLLENLGTQRGVKIQNSFDLGQKLMVEANRGKIQQVIQNLVLNAFDAVKDVPKPIINISSKINLNEVTIQIEDNGTGIDPAIQDKIFDPFFSTKEVNTGTGIGLSVCQDTIQNHSGDITFNSQLGQGSTFAFTLPLFKETLSRAS